ncbi:MAG: hypothetical protein H6926_05195 [Chromatiales bacterium]|nr:hypothetical protein [Gammaproteobacteria bacterium]MCP5352567.1 hypothetical protein [Chromatiales bacterium]
MTKAGVTLVLGAMLGGCAGFDAHFAEYDKEYRLQPGDVLVLETELAFPKDHARVKMQGDGPVGGVDEYHPYCEMEVTVVSDGGFKLLPDRFAVWKFSEQILPWNIVSVPMHVASGEPDSHSQITYISDIWLRSANQPEALKMSCRHVVEPQDRRHVTVAEMREALQGVFRIERSADK